jgi:hypothetical protein
MFLSFFLCQLAYAGGADGVEPTQLHIVKIESEASKAQSYYAKREKNYEADGAFWAAAFGYAGDKASSPFRSLMTKISSLFRKTAPQTPGDFETIIIDELKIALHAATEDPSPGSAASYAARLWKAFQESHLQQEEKDKGYIWYSPEQEKGDQVYARKKEHTIRWGRQLADVCLPDMKQLADSLRTVADLDQWPVDSQINADMRALLCMIDLKVACSKNNREAAEFLLWKLHNILRAKGHPATMDACKPWVAYMEQTYPDIKSVPEWEEIVTQIQYPQINEMRFIGRNFRNAFITAASGLFMFYMCWHLYWYGLPSLGNRSAPLAQDVLGNNGTRALTSAFSQSRRLVTLDDPVDAPKLEDVFPYIMGNVSQWVKTGVTAAAPLVQEGLDKFSAHLAQPASQAVIEAFIRFMNNTCPNTDGLTEVGSANPPGNLTYVCAYALNQMEQLFLKVCGVMWLTYSASLNCEIKDISWINPETEEDSELYAVVMKDPAGGTGVIARRLDPVQSTSAITPPPFTIPQVTPVPTLRPTTLAPPLPTTVKPRPRTKTPEQTVSASSEVSRSFSDTETVTGSASLLPPLAVQLQTNISTCLDKLATYPRDGFAALYNRLGNMFYNATSACPDQEAFYPLCTFGNTSTLPGCLTYWQSPNTFVLTNRIGNMSVGSLEFFINNLVNLTKSNASALAGLNTFATQALPLALERCMFWPAVVIEAAFKDRDSFCPLACNSKYKCPTCDFWPTGIGYTRALTTAPFLEVLARAGTYANWLTNKTLILQDSQFIDALSIMLDNDFCPDWLNYIIWRNTVPGKFLPFAACSIPTKFPNSTQLKDLSN